MSVIALKDTMERMHECSSVAVCLGIEDGGMRISNSLYSKAVTAGM